MLLPYSEFRLHDAAVTAALAAPAFAAVVVGAVLRRGRRARLLASSVGAGPTGAAASATAARGDARPLAP
ncbi:MAG TPA: hypothetical protein VGD56_02495 [Gemmatirosa sp.]